MASSPQHEGKISTPEGQAMTIHIVRRNRMADAEALAAVMPLDPGTYVAVFHPTLTTAAEAARGFGSITTTSEGLVARAVS